MQKLLFVNACFEEELSDSSFSIKDHLLHRSVPLQLHYLSCLLCKEEKPLLVLPPEENYYARLEGLGLTPPPYILLDSPIGPQIGGSFLYSWGPSYSLSSFAKQQGHVYSAPDISLVRRIQSKEFSFLHTPRLKGSALLTHQQELRTWWKSTPGPKALKTLYGSAGRGHFISYKDNEVEQATAFFLKNKSLSPAYIAEPWVERILDFSTQWFLSKAGSCSYLGSTLCENSKRGVYKKSLVGPESLLFQSYLPFLEEHLSAATLLLQKIQALGFFGPIGLDSMIYRCPESQKNRLLPIVEINARRTMGWAALALRNRLHIEDLLSLNYTMKKQKKPNLLPDQAKRLDGTVILFPGQLFIEKISHPNLICF